MIPENLNNPQAARRSDGFKTPHRGQKARHTSRVNNSPQRLTLDDLRKSRERLRLQTLQKKIALAPPLDRRPPEQLGDFLPQWFEKNVVKSGELLATASEALQEVLPEKLRNNIAFGPLQRGQLTLYCSSSTAKMELDMVLRVGSSGLRHLQMVTKGLIFKVKTVVDRAIVSD
jgi:hypothetical protein